MWSEAAVRPSGSVLSSDVFNTGLIKSDTDLRVYRDFGDVAGFDFAFLENTHLYHTPGDTLSAVREGSLQSSGDNLLPFVMAFASPEAIEGGAGF